MYEGRKNERGEGESAPKLIHDESGIPGTNRLKIYAPLSVGGKNAAPWNNEVGTPTRIRRLKKFLGGPCQGRYGYSVINVDHEVGKHAYNHGGDAREKVGVH